MSQSSPEPMAPARQRLSPPARYLVRMLLFLALVGFVVFILHEPMRTAFMANPGLNGLIIGVLLVGIGVALREVLRLGGEAKAGNQLIGGAPPTLIGALPVLSPLLAALPALRARTLPGEQASAVLDSVAVRLDEGRDTLRYLAGLLVFLGLLGTFWGLLETVSSVGGVIRTLRTGGEAGVLFEELKAGLAAPLAGMGLSFSSSLFGVAGSLVLGFLDLQLGQAQRRFRMELEDWMASGRALEQPEAAGNASDDIMRELARVAQTLSDNAGSGRQSTQAMANLAEGIQGLVTHMRAEQQMIRDWVEAQANREKETRRLLERLLSERTRAD